MKTLKTLLISVLFLTPLGLQAADEESQLDFVSTAKAFEAAEEGKNWVLIYVDWGR